eukprot:TRINITY_DN16443_c0_g1_i1.p1 TRINITY_DN16443_c0_g1~~TRINITY_DN16443_c0_g1_i1.p1  ORF type:complete len:411 (+),score=64.79 TRINITY_DN16443_c0_g1_i1:81-1313(+)
MLALLEVSALVAVAAAEGCDMASCGEKRENQQCQCDVQCADRGDCCRDFKQVCIPENLHLDSPVYFRSMGWVYQRSSEIQCPEPHRLSACAVYPVCPKCRKGMLCNNHAKGYIMSSGEIICRCRAHWTGERCESCDRRRWKDPECSSTQIAGGKVGDKDHVEDSKDTLQCHQGELNAAAQATDLWRQLDQERDRQREEAREQQTHHDAQLQQRIVELETALRNQGAQAEAEIDRLEAELRAARDNRQRAVAEMRRDLEAANDATTRERQGRARDAEEAEQCAREQVEAQRDRDRSCSDELSRERNNGASCNEHLSSERNASAQLTAELVSKSSVLADCLSSRSRLITAAGVVLLLGLLSAALLYWRKSRTPSPPAALVGMWRVVDEMLEGNTELAAPDESPVAIRVRMFR